MVGADYNNKQLVPVGVGKVQNRIVISVGEQRMTHMDYLGYALMGEAAKQIMQQYVVGQIDFQNMIIQLDTLLSQ